MKVQGYTVRDRRRRTMDVETFEATWIGILGRLSVDRDVRVWAAFGSAALSTNDGEG